MKEEFKLSEYIQEAEMLNKDGNGTNNILDVIPEEDVKKFIKRLKEEIKLIRKDNRPLKKEGILILFEMRINKLAGDLGE